jgi:tetratricopeptide (TPR) repeat protein
MLKLLYFVLLPVLMMCSNGLFAQTADIYQKAGDGHLNDKDYQAAFDNYTQAIKKSGHDNIHLSELYYKRGIALGGLRRGDEAISDFNKAIALNSQNNRAYWERGVIYDRNKNYESSISDYKKAMSLVKPDDRINLSILYCNIAYDELKLKNFTEAFQADSMSVVLNKSYSRAFQVRGNINYVKKNFKESVDDYTTAIFSFEIDDNKGVSYLFLHRADSESALKHYKDALNDYTTAIKLNPENGLAYWNRGAVYHYNSDFNLAVTDYTTAMTFYKNDSTKLSKLYDNRASNEAAQGLLTSAIDDESIAISLDSINKSFYFNKAAEYTQNGDYQTGIDIYTKMFPYFEAKNKFLAVLHLEIAVNEYFLSEFDKVIEDCSKAIALNPEDPSPYFYRGKVYLKKMNNKALAMNDFNKALTLDTTKKSVDYIFSLFYTGKGEEATATLQESILGTNNTAQLLSDYYNMACLYSLMNKPDEANIYLKKAFDNGYSKKYAAADDDLINIRNTDDYKSMMAASAN